MADFIGIIVDDPSLMVKLCCDVGVAAGRQETMSLLDRAVPLLVHLYRKLK